MNEISKTRKGTVEQSTRTLVDPETGEVYAINGVRKTYRNQKHFWKLFVVDFLSAIGIINSSMLEVVVYLMENVSNNNVVLATQAEISAATGVSKAWVNKTLKDLRQAEFLKMKGPGVYMISPAVLAEGSEAKRRGLLIEYHQADDVETCNDCELLGVEPVDDKEADPSEKDYSLELCVEPEIIEVEVGNE